MPNFRPALAALFAGLFLCGAAFTPQARALEECRLLRQPDIEGQTIVFAYGGDLWKVARAGGVATRITSHEGLEQFPKISPDGKTVAFTAEYDGNVDAYTVPIEGGEPHRLTWHPGADNVADWYPDGKSILIRSARASAPQRFDRFYRISADGGFEEPLALPTGGYAGFSANGKEIAYVYPAYDNRTWKRYRGGNAADIWTYDFATNHSERITDWEGSDEWPMWHGRTVYYCSDEGGRRANIWAYDVDKKTRRQVTHFEDYDVKWPSIGSDAMVFENGGFLYVMDLPGEKAAKIRVWVPDDKPATRAEYRNVSAWLGSWSLSPSAKRVAMEARGDIFSIPAEKGDVRNLTHSPGSRERGPEWSPDGKWVAYFSDRSGEYEIHVVGSDGKTPDRQVTHGIGDYPFELVWSPDSRKIAFSDETHTLRWCSVATGAMTKVDRGTISEIHDYHWSPDSRWLAYSNTEANQLNRVMLYSLESGRITPVSDGMSDDQTPVFDPEGRYLYFISSRTFNPIFGSYAFRYSFLNTDGIYAVTLRDTLLSPVAPQSDEETGEAASTAGGAGKGAGADKSGADRAGSAKPAAPATPPPAVRIDLAGLTGRVAVLPVKPGRYANLEVVKGKLFFVELGDPDPDPDSPPPGALLMFDLEKREKKTVISGVQAGYALSKDGGKVLYNSKDKYGIVDAAEGKKVGDGAIATSGLMAVVDPRQEWNQMFNEAWRLERDFYYDPAMGGLDWKAVGDHYRSLLPYVAHRSDLNYILGELIGELATSHTYVSGGDARQPARTGTGLLGADFELDAASGLYRFKRVFTERDWNSKVRAPLGEPGVRVHAGDYLFSVNGQPVRAPQNVFSAFVGTADQITAITVGTSPTDPAPRTCSVRPIASEASLRYMAWVKANREKVALATGGRVAYIHVPSTGIDGIQQFTEQYYPQVDKDGIVVDERFNSGGFIPNFFIEQLGRKTISYATGRESQFRTPATAIDGPKCILINQYAGSGGDAFPYYFKQAGLGPIIGKRTWGGLVGYSHGINLVDGGRVTMPDFGIWGPEGTWTAENHGIDPDIEVENTPSAVVDGHDPQLERAIQYCREQLQAHPVSRPVHPKYKVQASHE